MDENPYVENEAYDETEAVIEAVRRMTPEQFDAAMARDQDGYDTRERKHRTCRRCGQGGYAGDYPFSTYGGNLCDDCWE
jgi:hypothetical protein